VLSGTGLVLARHRARYDIPVAEYIIRIDVVLDGLDHAEALVAHHLLHPAAANLAHAVMMRQGATVGEDLVTRRRLDLVVHLDRVVQAVVVDGVVEVNTRARIVNLCYSL
jgi:hypothetical protein